MNFNAPDTPRSSLNGKACRLAAVGHLPVPGKGKRHKVQITVYEIIGGKTFVICLSEIDTRVHNPKDLQLGSQVQGDLIAPYAARCIGGTDDYEQVKEVIGQGWGDAKFRWWKPV